MIRKCSSCGKDYDLTENEIAFFESRGLTVPKRCKDCRNNKKRNDLMNHPSIKTFFNAAAEYGDMKSIGKYTALFHWKTIYEEMSVEDKNLLKFNWTMLRRMYFDLDSIYSFLPLEWSLVEDMLNNKKAE